MATYEQVIEALRAADAAGNIEDAQRLAQIAQSLSQQTQKATVADVRSETMAETGGGAAVGALAGSFLPACPWRSVYTRTRVYPARCARRGRSPGFLPPGSTMGRSGSRCRPAAGSAPRHRL